jgi:hypothetical protein
VVNFTDTEGVPHMAYSRKSLIRYFNHHWGNDWQERFNLDKRIWNADVAKKYFIDKTLSDADIKM